LLASKYRAIWTRFSSLLPNWTYLLWAIIEPSWIALSQGPIECTFATVLICPLSVRKLRQFLSVSRNVYDLLLLFASRTYLWLLIHPQISMKDQASYWSVLIHTR
jgi:hypothetical protein